MLDTDKKLMDMTATEFDALVGQSFKKHHCRVPLSDEVLLHLSHHVENIRQRGDGSFHAGINSDHDDHEFIKDYRTNEELKELQSDHRWVRAKRKFEKSIAFKAASVVVVAVVTFIMALVGLGAKSHFGG